MNVRIWIKKDGIPEELVKEAEEMFSHASLGGYRVKKPSSIEKGQGYHLDLDLCEAKDFMLPEGIVIEKVTIHDEFQSEASRKRGKYVLGTATAYLEMRTYDMGDEYTSGKEIVHSYGLQLTAATVQEAAELSEKILAGTIWPEQDWDAPQSGPPLEVSALFVHMDWPDLTWLERRVLPRLLRKLRITVLPETQPAPEPKDILSPEEETADEAATNIAKPNIVQQTAGVETDEDTGAEIGV